MKKNEMKKIAKDVVIKCISCGFYTEVEKGFIVGDLNLTNEEEQINEYINKYVEMMLKAIGE